MQRDASKFQPVQCFTSSWYVHDTVITVLSCWSRQTYCHTCGNAFNPCSRTDGSVISPFPTCNLQVPTGPRLLICVACDRSHGRNSSLVWTVSFLKSAVRLPTIVDLGIPTFDTHDGMKILQVTRWMHKARRPALECHIIDRASM